MPTPTTETPESSTDAQMFFGKYRGVVTDVEDPRGQGRIRARVPEVLGDVETGWALPCAPYAGDGAGLFTVPPTGAGVWIEFEGGIVTRPIWSGCWWASGQAPAGGSATVRTLTTDAGHSITVDDEGGIEIVCKDGPKIVLDSSGILLDGGGAKIEITGSGVKVNDGALEVI